MRCPKCTHVDSRVLDSRSVGSGASIRRRRVCSHCGHRFTTYEEIMKATLRVIKRDGRQEDYDRPKLKTAIENACIKRSIPAQRIENLLMEVETEITQEYEWEVPSTTIGRKVAEKLAKLDEVAYLRYISIYRRFHDASQFLSEIENLIERQ